MIMQLPGGRGLKSSIHIGREGANAATAEPRTNALGRLGQFNHDCLVVHPTRYAPLSKLGGSFIMDSTFNEPMGGRAVRGKQILRSNHMCREGARIQKSIS